MANRRDWSCIESWMHFWWCWRNYCKRSRLSSEIRKIGRTWYINVVCQSICNIVDSDNRLWWRICSNWWSGQKTETFENCDESWIIVMYSAQYSQSLIFVIFVILHACVCSVCCVLESSFFIEKSIKLGGLRGFKLLCVEDRRIWIGHVKRKFSNENIIKPVVLTA